MSILWAQVHCYAFPPPTKQNTTRPSIHSNIDNTLLANTVVVSASVGNSDKDTNSDTKFNHTFSRSKRESSSISVKQNSYISGMAGFREGLSLQGVSEETTQLIGKSRRQSALGNYESTWKKWSGWCDSWKTDPFRCPVNYVLEHLSSLFYHEKLLYRTIGLHRSVIPAYHVHVDDKPIGQLPLVCSYLSGIFNSRPPQPKHLFVWDVQEVLNFIKSTWGETDILGEKKLSLKLRMLLALTRSSRASGIHHLNIRFMLNTGDKVTFHSHKLHESWRKGKPPPCLTVYVYSLDKQLCVVQTLNRYLEMTKDRKDPSRTQLFLSYRKPYKEIASSTVSGWIKKVLQLANVDTNVFKGHSNFRLRST